MAIDPKYKPIFTLVGLNKIANAINSGVKIELQKMALGDANGIDYTPNESMTALTHEVVRFNLRTLWYENVTSINKTILKFTGILEPGVISSKTVREVGVYDNTGDLIILFRIPDRPILTDGNIATILDLTFGITLSTDSNVFMTLGENTGNFVTLTEYNGHVNNLNNPHNVNKAQVGLPLADNTRDIDKVVLSAGKLTTVRTINGTNFDGSTNVIVPINVTTKNDNINYVLPFVSGTGNQSTYIDNDGNLIYNPSTNTLSSANFTGNLSGNATTVSKLTLTDATNPVVGTTGLTQNTIGNVVGISVLGQSDGALISQYSSNLWEYQIFGDYRSGAMATRGKNNGAWQPWKTVAYLDSSITGNAATATKLQTARTITLSGDISSSVSFDGSANVTLNTTLPSIITAGTYRSVTVNAKGLVTVGTNPTTLSGYGITDAVTASRASATFDAAANTWYRIATSAVDILKNSGVFAIDWSRSGQHGTVRFSADCTYGDATDGVSIMQLNYSKFGNAPISEARIVYNTAYTANYAYLEVKFADISSGVLVNVELLDAIGWSLVTPNTSGNIPVNYISHTLTFVPSLKIVSGTFPKVTFNQEGRVISGASLIASDIPSLDTSKLTTGVLPLSRGGTGVTTSTGTGNLVFSSSPVFTDSPTAPTPAAGDSSTKLATTAFVTSNSVPPGTIISFAGLTPPTGFLSCNGSAISRTVYSALFAAIGRLHGNGDGSTTFNLPDLRGEFIRGADVARGIDYTTVTGWSYVGQTITVSTSKPHDLKIGNLINISGLVATTNAPNGSFYVVSITGTNGFTFSASATPTGAATVSSAKLTRTVGSWQADEFKSHTHYYIAPSQTNDSAGGSGTMQENQYGTQTGAAGGLETRPRNIAMLYCIKY